MEVSKLGDTEFRQSLLGLEAGSEYAIRVRSIDGLGNTSNWSEALQVTASDVSSSSPMAPTNIVWDWSGRTINVSWDPVLSNIDGSIADIAFYEFVICDFNPSTQVFTIINTYRSNTTSFTYTYDQSVATWAPYMINPPYSTRFVISAVSRSGFRSPKDLYNSKYITHAHVGKPVAPTLVNNGSDILIMIDPGYDCFDEIELYCSSDGGDTWAIVGNFTTKTYSYTPENANDHYFMYRLGDVYTGSFGEESEISYISSGYNPPDPIGDWDSGFAVYSDRNRTYFGGTFSVDVSGGSHNLGTIPAPMRPAATLELSTTIFDSSTHVGEPGKVNINHTTGVVTVTTVASVSSTCYVNLEGLSFRRTRP